VKVLIEFHEKRILDANRRGSLVALRRAGAYLRQVARHMVSKSPKASDPGSPPHTRHGLLKRSILFGVDNQAMTVVIGPAASMVGTSMQAHEFGGRYRKQDYPKRPLMGPTLEASASKLPQFWEDSLKQ